MPGPETKGITLREIIAPFEAEVLAKVETLYPDEGERIIISEILIPQFKKLLADVIPEGIVFPGKLHAVCDALDKAIEDNKALLDTEGLFQPLLREVTKVREQIAQAVQENFLESAREALRAHGIIDRRTLLEFRANKFALTDFPPYGKGFAFAGKIFGRTSRHISSEILEEIADAVGFVKEPEEGIMQKKYLEVLTSHGIADRGTLLKFGINKFAGTDFSPFGKGNAFAGKILGRTVRYVTAEILEEIADAMGFEKKPEAGTMQKKYLEALRAHEIIDWATLRRFGPDKFRCSDFPPYGKGNAFAGKILGRTVYSISTETLEEIAKKLELESMSEQTRQQYLEALGKCGIIDKASLLRFGAMKFRHSDFPLYGKGHSFASEILVRTVDSITIEILEEIAERLRLDYLSEGTRKKYLETLSTRGITDRTTLLNFGTKKFTASDFPPYGKGYSFAGEILGRMVTHITIEILEEIAEKVQLGPISDETKQKYLEALRIHGIVDRISLMNFGSNKFRMSTFPPYGKGAGFIAKILGRKGERVSIEILEEVADMLGFMKEPEAVQSSHANSLVVGENAIRTLKEIITPFEAEILAKMEILYPDEGEREIVTEILIPQFRSLLMSVIPEGIVSPGELPAICEAIDIVVEQNCGLLDTEGLFKPLMEKMKKVRTQISEAVQENFLERARATLSTHGIIDRITLLDFGTEKFMRSDFPPYGKGIGFAGKILGMRVKYSSIRILEEIADTLGFPRSALASVHWRQRKARRNMTPHPVRYIPELPEEILIQERLIA